MGAVQAQDYASAKWALGLRLADTTDAQIELAFNEGRILRTHVLRPTWHFVTPYDIQWLLKLTSPRVNTANAYANRRTKLDAELFNRSNKVITKSLEGRQHLTRIEISNALEAAGIRAKGLRLIYLLMRAELDGIICSGPRRGKQFTYALLEERSFHSRKSLDRKEALASLAKRYFEGHGPATLRDFAWWSGLTTIEAKEGLAMASSTLDHKEIDGRDYWFPSSLKQDVEVSGHFYLLPAFDEFLVGYASYDKSRRRGSGLQRKLFNSAIVSEGSVVGSWRRELKNGIVSIEVAPFAKMTGDDSEAVLLACERYGRFLGMPITCSFKSLRS